MPPVETITVHPLKHAKRHVIMNPYPICRAHPSVTVGSNCHSSIITAYHLLSHLAFNLNDSFVIGSINASQFSTLSTLSPFSTAKEEVVMA
jgi:hypothetical protein